MAAPKIAKKRSTFSFDAEAQTVLLAGDFTNWGASPLALTRAENGQWEKVVLLPPGRYEYKFIVDGFWVMDPACAEHVPNDFGTENCVRVVG